MKDDPSDGRRAHRFHAGLHAAIHLDACDLECRAHDLSRNGVQLVGRFEAPDVEEVWVTLRSTNGDLVVTLPARIVHFDFEDASGEAALGVEFLEVASNDRATLAALLSRVVEGKMPAELEDLPSNPTPAQIRSALEKIPLPHRIQLASRAQPKEREILRHDPQPQVVDALARNPGVLPHELVAILRLKHLLPHTLDALARDTRWAGNEQVRVLIATHRNTPLAAARSVVASMGVPTLRKVMQAPDLNPALRENVLRRIPGGRRP